MSLATAFLFALILPQAAGANEELQSSAEGRLQLFGDVSLADPWFLLLLPLALLALWHGRRASAQERARVPVLPASSLPRTLAQRLTWLPSTLQGAALALLVLAVARPLRGDVETTSVSEGVDIALVIDRSSSMQFEDLERGSSRLEVVKRVVAEFAERRMTDRVDAADSVALITFARYPRLLCPFTLDVGALTGFLEGVELAATRDEDGTAIGVGLAKAVGVLEDSDARSRVCVLLTDGENNFDDIPPREAANLAAEQGVKVYTIYAARHVYGRDPFGRTVRTDEQPDTSELEEIAALTGGRFFRASDRADLEGIYAEIERLEKTPRTERRFEETYDLYLLLLLPALGCYVLAWCSNATWARRLP